MMRPQLQRMTLVVTERCNQRCAYCSVDTARGRTMNEETARAAVDLLFEGSRRRDPRVLAFFGGEPFLANSTIVHAAEHARLRRRLGQRLRFVSPTNATALSEDACRTISRFDVELAVSLDGQNDERRFANGRLTADAVRSALPRLRTLGTRRFARMTVTPRSAPMLAENVRLVAEAGFDRILYMPVVEAAWDASALEAWAEQHRVLCAWIAGAIEAGAAVPTVEPLAAIRGRLAGAPKRQCGAGVTRVAVDTDGTIRPCQRMAWDARADETVLGHVGERRWRDDRLAAYAALSPATALPEDGDCAECPALDGCLQFCPADGLRVCGDIRRVPAVCCALTRPQVAAVRRLDARLRRLGRHPRWQGRAIAASALGITLLSAAGCNTDRSLTLPDGGTDLRADAALPPDLARPDLSRFPDLAGPDLSRRPDLFGVPTRDMAVEEDMPAGCIAG